MSKKISDGQATSMKTPSFLYGEVSHSYKKLFVFIPINQ